MTERLYYDDSYLCEFDALVTAVEDKGDKKLITLDRSAFYPTSGGQPYDTGTISDCMVTDVFVDKAGEVWHEVDGDFAVGESVHGKIDWERRFDHMQQHGGEHMIAGAFYTLTDGMTIGLHLGAEVSSIDVEFADGSTHVSRETIQSIEDYVNERIQRDVPVRCWFPDADELKALPLRKPPTVSEHVRIVAFGDFEMVACGGTHPSTTGQIGLVKIVSAQPARGKLRVSFVCGKRALRDYRTNYNAAWNASNLLSCRPEDLERNISLLQERLLKAEKENRSIKKEQLLDRVPQMIRDAYVRSDGIRIIKGLIETETDILKDLASELIKNEQVLVLLGTNSADRCNVVFAASQQCGIHMGRLLGEAAKQCGGKGGGRPDFAQGAGSAEMIEAAFDMVK